MDDRPTLSVWDVAILYSSTGCQCDFHVSLFETVLVLLCDGIWDGVVLDDLWLVKHHFHVLMKVCSDKKVRTPITATRVVYLVVVPHALCGTEMTPPA